MYHRYIQVYDIVLISAWLSHVTRCSLVVSVMRIFCHAFKDVSFCRVFPRLLHTFILLLLIIIISRHFPVCYGIKYYPFILRTFIRNAYQRRAIVQIWHEFLGQRQHFHVCVQNTYTSDALIFQYLLQEWQCVIVGNQEYLRGLSMADHCGMNHCFGVYLCAGFCTRFQHIIDKKSRRMLTFRGHVLPYLRLILILRANACYAVLVR
mmetsp:Transcript_21124/g.32243  ORF Transcript_21124/g.32243 Transcript_21124/m.32243 type:complete len:207 (-) Transcript_21124:577-1197(-)